MSKIKIVPLGGLRENGKNMYVTEIGEDIFVLDCGLLYPEGELFGIDAVIPGFSYLRANKDRIAGVFLTHGHEDAIGALPYFIDEFDVPVFGTELTIELAKLFVQSTGLPTTFDDYHVVDEDTLVEFNETAVSFFKVTHSIPDAVGVSLKTDKGNIVYTGNFKFDHSAEPMYQTDLKRIAHIGNEGVLVLLSDSADAESPYENVSELVVAEEVLDTFQNAPGRIIIAAVASNILRIQQVLDAAERSKRKVFIAGKKLVDIVEIAIRMDKLILPDEHLIVEMTELDKYDDSEVVILETGPTGEPLKTLNRMASGRHSQVNIKQGDLIYIVTSPSSSMEVTVADTENQIYRAGGYVKQITDNLKVSGHGTPNDLKLMMNLLKPTYFIPVQGEYRLLAAHARLAHETGIPYKNIFVLGNGDVLEYDDNRMRATGHVEASNTLIDGTGVGDIGNIVLRDRRLLSEDGIFVAVVTIDRRKGKIVSKPQIVTRGFVFVKESIDLIEASTEIVTTVLEDNLAKKEFDWSTLKQEMRDALGKYLFNETKRRPIILPVIMEVSANKRRNRK